MGSVEPAAGETVSVDEAGVRCWFAVFSVQWKRSVEVASGQASPKRLNGCPKKMETQ